jgi:hypothetical protein
VSVVTGKGHFALALCGDYGVPSSSLEKPFFVNIAFDIVKA